MPRQWRCANGHEWTGDLGALTYCPECGSADVYEVRPQYQSVGAQAAPGSPPVDQTFIQPPAHSTSVGDTYVQPLPSPTAAKIADTVMQMPAAVGDTLLQPIAENDPGTTQQQVYVPEGSGDTDGGGGTLVQPPPAEAATLNLPPAVSETPTVSQPLFFADGPTMIGSQAGRTSGTAETRVFGPPADGGSIPSPPAEAPTLDGSGHAHAILATTDHSPTESVQLPAEPPKPDLSQMDTRPAPPPSPRVKDPRPAGPPALAGYEILGTLGRGGMGVVYKARQVKLNRVVALKMILAGGHAGAYERQRFVTEMHAVAALTHPNIVQIYETGERDGLPFFSLEFCDGGSLQQKLAGQPLPPKQAADIGEQLARAMQYAHERGIVHRDLKPANILFSGEEAAAARDKPTPSKDSKVASKDLKSTGDSVKSVSQSRAGQSKTGLSFSSRGSSSSPSMRASRITPKVTDFGLAKRFEEESGLTGSGTILGTPSYMAPEQAAGQGRLVGPPADIHALGAIVYEMLTGRPPFLGENIVETMNQVRTLDPVPPSRIQPKTPRDLETICLKCLQKEIHKRYATAGDLADDLRRFLDGEPIAARPVSTFEKSWKWAKRRPAAAAFVALLVAVLISGAVGGIAFGQYKQSQAEKEKRLKDDAVAAFRQAEENFKAARQAVDDLLVKVGSEKLEHVPRAERLRKALLEQALEFYNRFLQVHGDDPNLRREAGWAYQRVGRIRNDLGDRRAAIAAYKEAIGFFDPLSREATGKQMQDKLELAQTQRQLAVILEAAGRPAEADAAYDAGRTVLRELADSQPDRPEYHLQLGELLLDRGGQYFNRRRLTEAEDYCRQALTEYDRLCKDDPSVVNRFRRAKAQANVGAMILAAGRVDLAAQELAKAREFLTAVLQDAPDNPEYAKELAEAELNLATARFQVGKLDDAKAIYQRSISRLQKQVKDFPGIADYRFSLAVAHDNYAVFLKTTAGLKTAEPQRLEARKLFDDLRRNFPDNVEFRLRYAFDLDEHAILLAETDKLREAIAEEKAAVELLAEIAATDPANPGIVRETARRHLNLGQLYARGRQIEEAEAEYGLAVGLLKGLADRRLPGDESWYDLPTVYLNQAKLFEDQGRGSKAVEWSVRQAAAFSRQIAAAHPDRADALAGLAVAEFNLASLPTLKPAEAVTLTRDAVERQRAALALAPKRADLIVGMGIYGSRLVTILADQGDHAAAAAAVTLLSRDIPDWRGWPAVAGQLARCVRLARADKTLSDDEKAKLSAAYGTQSLDLLRKAVAAGYTDAAALKDSPELEVLRTDPAFRAGFETILAGISGRNSK